MEDADKAIAQMAKNKALGPDGFGINLLLDPNNLELRTRACSVLIEMANSGKIPDFLKTSRGCFLSKDKSSKAKLEDIRLIQISPHLLKILEIMIGNKLEDCNSAIVRSGSYQVGLKKFSGTQELIAHVLIRTLLGKSFIFVDFSKAFDNINRRKLCELLRQVAVNERDITSHCVELIISLLHGQMIEIFGKNIKVEKGVM